MLGLLTSAFGGVVSTCNQSGTCSPVAESDCGSYHEHDHTPSEDPSDAPHPHDESDDDGDSDDLGTGHHHCQKISAGNLALPPVRPLLPPLLFLAHNHRPLAMVQPEAPVFSLEQPPRG